MPLYFVRAGTRGPVKIGYCKNISARMQIMTRDNHCELTVLRLVECMPRAEREAHRKFWKFRVRGEWFSYRLEMMTWLPSKIWRIPEQPKPKVDWEKVFESFRTST